MAQLPIITSNLAELCSRWKSLIDPVLAQQASANALSNSCNVFNTTSTTYVDITNLQVNITTSGRPVMAVMVPDNSSSGSYVEVGGSGIVEGFIQIMVDGVAQGSQQLYGTSYIIYPCGCISFVLSSLSAGQHLIKLRASVNVGTTTLLVARARLFVYEV